MGKRIKAIDDYIARSAPFTQPVLRHIRNLVHEACPDTEEKIKWSFPHFDYKGEMMCSMAAFKQHCAVNFWKASLMKDPALMDNARSETSMGHLGRISSLKDLPSDKKMTAYIREAMKLNDEGVKLPARLRSAEKKELVIPPYFRKELKKHKKAEKTFNNFSHSHKKEYIEWITGAKTDATRDKRLATAMEWMTEGKPQNWRYIK